MQELAAGGGRAANRKVEQGRDYIRRQGGKRVRLVKAEGGSNVNLDATSEALQYVCVHGHRMIVVLTVVMVEMVQVRMW